MSPQQHPKKNDQLSSDVVLEELESIFDRLRKLLSAEYERGGTQAAARIVSALSRDSGLEHLHSTNLGHLQSNKKPLVRAPRGAAQSLVQRCLAGGPKTIREIREAAETEVEKFLSYQTVRLELERGKASKRYKKNKDQWSLAK